MVDIRRPSFSELDNNDVVGNHLASELPHYVDDLEHELTACRCSDPNVSHLCGMFSRFPIDQTIRWCRIMPGL